jgi:hypothetical protein
MVDSEWSHSQLPVSTRRRHRDHVGLWLSRRPLHFWKGRSRHEEGRVGVCGPVRCMVGPQDGAFVALEYCQLEACQKRKELR